MTPEQIQHNRELDLKIKEWEEKNKLIDEMNNLKIQEWNKYREEELKRHPDKYIPESCPFVDMSYPNVVGGVRYVD